LLLLFQRGALGVQTGFALGEFVQFRSPLGFGLLGVAAGALQVLYHLSQRRLLHAQRFGRLLRYTRRQSQPPRNLDRVACAWHAHQQAVGRLQGLKVELHRGVDEVWVAVGERLQFAVVGGGDHARLAL
jgi:hypothetical protein